ncbi:MAG TPA: serine hydrolase domain-containing protein [Bryobacteraceae bacterium]|nr:serine hydrolase domain-containing protein [Bryobacteraceae bacterium]
MSLLNRRQFTGAAVAFGARASHLWGATGIDDTLRGSMQRRKIPAVAAMAATAAKTTYSGAFGKRDSASGVDVRVDSLFAIASMTKAITTTAALQLVERGKLTLDEPASKHLPELGKLNVLEGFDSAGKPKLRPAVKPVTLRNLLTHTSGFAYDTWDADILRYTSQEGGAIPPGTVAPLVPLAFEPGTRWQYGYGLDWAGRLVETASGQTLEQYFQANILQPLGMKDTSFILPAGKFDRLVSVYTRQSDGALKQNPRTMPAPPKAFNGGGGLFSTAPDYVRFMQMILNQGRAGKEQILQPKTVEMMSTNQVGALAAGRLNTARPAVSSDVDFHPGATDKYTFGFLMNPTAYEGGRSAGSLAWAGVYNTYYWIDPRRSLCAVVMMQFLPFADKEGVGLLGDFEKAVYANA